jgi:hypothetical protein
MAIKIGKNRPEAVTPGDTPVVEPITTTGEPVADTPPPRKRSRVPLFALIPFLLVGAALAAWKFLTPNPAEEVDAGEPSAVMSGPRREQTVVTKTVPKTAVVPPGDPAKRVKPGDAGIMPQDPQVPAVIKPETPGKPPRMVPVKGVPTPIQPPSGLAGTPGKRGSRGTVVVQPVAPSPDVMAQLKALWKQGAEAKKRGNIVGARKAWQEMLRVRPGHPGVQDAIDKLPKT